MKEPKFIGIVIAVMIIGSSLIAQPFFADNQHIRSDGTSISDWDNYDDVPAGSEISLTFDPLLQSNVVLCEGTSEHAFLVGNDRNNNNANSLPWNDTRTHLELKYRGGAHVLGITVTTNQGNKSIAYWPQLGEANVSGDFLQLYIGDYNSDTVWQTFRRNVKADVESFDGFEFVDIDGFVLRPSDEVQFFSVDDIITFELSDTSGYILE